MRPATDQAAARSAIGAGTSDLAIGTTASTAKAGNYVPTWGEITSKPATFAPSTHTHLWADITNPPATYTPSAHSHVAADISNSTTVGRSVLTAADAAAARTAIGAGTSSLALGTTASTAKAGDYQPTWTQVTSKPTTFPPDTHTHTIAQVTNLQTTLDAKAVGFTNTTPATIKHVTLTEAEYAAYDATAKADPTYVFVVRP